MIIAALATYFGIGLILGMALKRGLLSGDEYPLFLLGWPILLAAAIVAWRRS
jgi:hypothetical protein